MRMDDLNIFDAPQLPGPSSNVKFRQGVLTSFDRVTLENIVLVGGESILNLPLLGVAEISNLRPGTSVGLMVMEGTDGSTSYAILGQLVRPNTPAATVAVNGLNERMYAADNLSGVIGSTTSASPSYTSLGGAGPVVEDVWIGPAGRAILMLGCGMQSDATNSLAGGEMTVAISGATTRGPSTDYSVRLNHSTAVAHALDDRLSMVSIVHDLTPGANTFTGMYRSSFEGNECVFFDPIIAVLSL